MTFLMILTGALAIWLAAVLALEKRCYSKAKKTLYEAKKVFESAQESFMEADKKNREAEVELSFKKATENQRWYRHYAFYPLGQLPLSELSEADMRKIRTELSVVLGKRIRKYFEPKEITYNGQRVLMIDLLIKENKNE